MFLQSCIEMQFWYLVLFYIKLLVTYSYNGIISDITMTTPDCICTSSRLLFNVCVVICNVCCFHLHNCTVIITAWQIYSECVSSIGPRQRLQHQGGLSQRWEVVYCVHDTGSAASQDPSSELRNTEKDYSFDCETKLNQCRLNSQPSLLTQNCLKNIPSN